jgi:hypothetical protein
VQGQRAIPACRASQEILAPPAFRVLRGLLEFKDQPVSQASLEIRATPVTQVLPEFRDQKVLRAPPASRREPS